MSALIGSNPIELLYQIQCLAYVQGVLFHHNCIAPDAHSVHTKLQLRWQLFTITVSSSEFVVLNDCSRSRGFKSLPGM